MLIPSSGPVGGSASAEHQLVVMVSLWKSAPGIEPPLGPDPQPSNWSDLCIVVLCVHIL